jgi:YHS domain-containing protein
VKGKGLEMIDPVKGKNIKTMKASRDTLIE